MTEKVLQVNGIELWTEDFGDPAVLLIMGAESQGTAWPLPLIERLCDTERYVITYDNRDVGLSTCIDFAASPYTLNDMMDDAIGILDAYGIERAHVVGASMGGMITQLLMIHHPERLLSATVIMSTPLAGNPDERGIPQLFDEHLPRGPFMDQVQTLMMPVEAPKSRDAYVERRVEAFAMLSDPANVDLDLLRMFFEMEYDRARDITAKANHTFAIARTEPWDRRPPLEACTTPTTVIHGENDPILPSMHGKAVADAVPGAKMVTVPSMGHDLPAHVWPIIVDAVRG